MKKTWKVLIIILAVIIGLLLLVRFVASPIAKVVIEKNSEEWIGREVEIGSLSISALTGNVRIKNLRITDEADTATFASWQELYVNISLARLLGKHVYLRHIHLSDFCINVWNDGQRFNFSDLPQRFASEDTTATSSNWRISLNDIRLRNGNIAYSDKKHNQKWDFEHLRLDVPGLEFGTGQTDAGLRFDLPDNSGQVTLNGAYDMQSNMYSLIADLKYIDLHFLLPVIQEHISTGGIDGWLGAHIVAHGSLDDVMGVQVQGNAQVEDLELRDTDRKTVAEVSRIGIGISSIVPKTMSLKFDSIAIDSVILGIVRDNNGNTLSRLLASPESEQEEDSVQTEVPAQTNSTPLKLTVNKLALRNSQINLTDKTLSSRFSYKIRGINVSAQNLSNNGQNHILLNGSLPDGGSMMLNWRGSLDYKKKDARVVAMLRNVQLKDLSPWVEDLFAYPVKQGILSLTSDNSISGGIIDGMQKIEIADLKLGRKENRSDAEFKSVPLKSAIGLMTDMSGKILLEVPVEGDLNEPKFSLDKVIGRAIGNTLVKATIAPFVAMAQASGIKAGDLTQMSVDLLQPDISLEQYKKLDLIAQMMTEQKNVSLVMVQQFNLKSAIEDQALFNIKRAYYEQQNSAIGALTLLDIENIQKINTGDIGLKRYAEELTGKKGKITVTAVEYYTTDSLQQQILRQADMRNAILTRYLTQQKDISPKRISITTDSLSNLTAYKGQNRYEVSSQLEDEE